MSFLPQPQPQAQKFSSLIILAFLFLIITTFTEQFVVSINKQFSQINQVTNYKIATGQYNVRGYFIPSGSLLLVTFPPQYNTTALHSKTYTGYSKADADTCYPDFQCQGVTVTYSGNSFVISGIFTSDIPINQQWYFQYTIFGIQNPPSISVGLFRVTIYSGSTIYYPPAGFISNTSFKSNFTPQSVNYTAEVLFPTIWGISPLKLVITPKNVIDSIRLRFNSQWAGQETIKGTIRPNSTFISISNPSMQTVLAQSSFLEYTLSNLYYYTPLQPIDITINSILTPSSVRPAGPIKITLISNNIVLEQSEFSLPASSFTNNVLYNSSAEIINQTDTQIDVLLTFRFPQQQNILSDRIFLTFPQQLVIPEIQNTSYFLNIATKNISWNDISNGNSKNNLTFNVSSNSSKAQVLLTVKGISRPRQCLTTSNFTINTYRSSQFLMDSITCCQIQLSNRQTLKINEIFLSDSQSRKTSTYTFNFTTSVINLLTTDQIKITFPPQYSSAVNLTNNESLCSGVTIVGARVKPPSAFECNVYMNQLTLSSFLTSSYNSSQTSMNFEVKVVGVENPAFTPTTGFTISTFSSNNYVLEQAQGYSIKITSNILTNFSVSASSLQTCAQNTKYIFTLGNNSPLSNGYTIKIFFPSDYTYINKNTLQCQVNNATYPCFRTNFTVNTTNIIVSIKITIGISVITSVSISSVTNPVSRATTGSFSAIIYDQAGNEVQSSSGTYTITMASTSAFTFFTASATNISSSTPLLSQAIQLLNSNSNSLWISMVVPFTPLVTASSMLITISNADKLEHTHNVSTCISKQILSACNITSNNETNNIEVIYPILIFASLSSNYIQIQVTDLYFVDYQNIQISASLSINGFQSLLQTPSVGISKLYAQPISNYGVTFDNQFLGESSTANLTIGLSNLTNVNNFVVYVPQQFGVASRVINYPVASFVSNKLTITGLTNPTVEKYSPFLFAIYNANGDLIAFSSPTDSTKIYTFTLGCALPCRNCALGLCVDCYTSISWIGSIYLRNSTKTCVAQCSEGEYLSDLPNGICYACDSNCLTCLMYGSGFTNGNSTYCLTCSPYNSLFGTTCVISCPSGFYSNFSVCASCMPNCLNCISSSTCTSCKSGLSLYNNSCLITCPTFTVSYTNTVTLLSSCLNCSSNCLSCSSLPVPLCLSCSSGYYLYNGACYTSCSGLSLYISYQMTCASCQCANCTIYSYVCNACNSSYNLYRSQCITTCPSGYYPSNNICQSCQTNCLSCNSSTYCSLCLIPTALYITNSSFSSCYQICPSSTIATIDAVSLSFMCSSCGGNCLTCQTSITFCLSCKPGFILNNNTCESGCPSGLWPISGLCRTCALQCQICLITNPYNCSLCSSNYFYYNFSCNSTCPDGTYPNILTSKCSACNNACKTCVNSTNCTSCANNSYFYQYFCYSNCSSINSSFYSYNGACLICQPQCLTCLNTPFECSSCAASAYYFNPIDKSCAFNCTHPYYINGTYCSFCQSPCTTCDTLYTTCSSCSGSLTLWKGQCISSCPSGFYNLSNICNQCNSTCLTCNATACLTCQAYAYRYYKTCVLDCKNTDLPITIGSYCTSCAQVPYCQRCQTGVTNNFICFVCIYPFVIFDGNCLNACPNFYVVDDSNTCIPSPSYNAYKDELYRKNYPYLPPFSFVGILVLVGCIFFKINSRIYKYTYHYGYLIALSTVIELIFLAYGVRYIIDLYAGDYTNENKYIPAYILAGSFFLKITIALGYVFGVIGKYYLNDIRFREWKEQHQKGFKAGVALTLILGSRFFKLYYSKLFGKQVFSYRIVSVQKFFYEDVVTWMSIIPDIIDIVAFANINYNIFISYSVLYLLSFQLFVLKGMQWLLLAKDFKKPDRGFFLGDEEEAERMIQQQKQAKQKQKREFQMESLIKLIRRKSAGHLHYQKLYENIIFDDFRSVYNPSDYEEVPKVPNQKIQKNINKGKFRKGKRITIEQKLKRFAQSVKPTPPVPQDNGYIRGLIYWKPPKQIKIQKKAKKETIQSQQSMMKLLQDKQLFYQDISSIHIIDLDDDSGTQHDDLLQSRYKKRKRTGFGIDGQETVINDMIYDPTSIEHIEPEVDYDLNGLWNKNYARKQHLPHNIAQNRYDQNDLRVLNHEPHKKRKSKLNEIRSKYY